MVTVHDCILSKIVAKRCEWSMVGGKGFKQDVSTRLCLRKSKKQEGTCTP